MVEEEKVEVTAAPVVEEPVTPKQDPEEQKRASAALAAFIMSLISLVVAAWIPFVTIAGIVLAAIALKKCGTAKGVTTKPHSIFVKIAKPVAIVGLIASIIMTIVYSIYVIIVPILVALEVIASV